MMLAILLWSAVTQQTQAQPQDPPPLPPIHGGPAPMTCPVGGERFSAWRSGSYSTYGSRPDGKPFSYMTFPFPLPECPSNKLIVFDDFKPDEVKALATLIPRIQADGESGDALLPRLLALHPPQPPRRRHALAAVARDMGGQPRIEGRLGYTRRSCANGSVPAGVRRRRASPAGVCRCAGSPVADDPRRQRAAPDADLPRHSGCSPTPAPSQRRTGKRPQLPPISIAWPARSRARMRMSSRST